MSFHPFDGAFGLDIGDRGLKIVYIKSKPMPFRPEFKLISYGRTNIPAGILERGEIIKAEDIIKVIKELVKKITPSSKHNWAVASVPENKTFLKYAPISLYEEIDQKKVYALAEENIPAALNELYIDWQIIPPHSDKTERGLLIAAIPKKAADSYTYLLEIAGLTPIAFELESIAIARALIEAHQKEREGATGILDIGATRTSFIIYDHNAVQFSQTYEFSGERLTELISLMFNITLDEAENKKQELGIEYKNYTRKQWSVMIRELTHFVHEIKRGISFYTNSFKYARPLENIYLCGGGSNTIGIDKALSTQLKISVHAGNPWQNLFTKAISPLTQSDLNSYATAIGLALRAADNPLIKRDDI
jgi:type IV pilus assembly protein PilM